MAVGGLVFVLSLSLAHLLTSASARLAPSFYKDTCPGVEAFIEAKVKQNVTTNPRLAAKLLRLHFHDCFVQGCDGSILLDATDNEPAEKDAEINLTVGGYEFIDELKDAVEKKCPGTVSCADILALAARDSVRHRGGPWIPLLTGRRDGFASRNPNANTLPTFVGGVKGLLKTFADVGLNTMDMVVLSGGHTLGMGTCTNVQERIPPFQPDGLLSGPFLKNMSGTCLRRRKLQPNNLIPLDAGSPHNFDNNYYKNLLQERGTFITDSLLSVDSRTRRHVQKWATNNLAFFQEFKKSFQKMSQIQVLTRGQGEIRLDCRMTNEY